MARTASTQSLDDFRNVKEAWRTQAYEMVKRTIPGKDGHHDVVFYRRERAAASLSLRAFARKHRVDDSTLGRACAAWLAHKGIGGKNA